MFYCDPCAKKYGYPQSERKSAGPCESCGKLALCNDVPSYALRETRKRKRKKRR